MNETMKLIFNILEKDCRVSVTEIAKKADISRTTAYYYIDRLKKENYIGGYTIKKGKAFSQYQVKCLMFIKYDEHKTNRAVKIISNMWGVKTINYLYGEWDTYIEIEVEEMKELDLIRKNIHLVDGIQEIRSYIVQNEYEL